MNHFHVATGLQGYGPDAADGYGTYAVDALSDVAEAIRGELADAVDYLWQSHSALGEAGQYEDAYRAIVLTQHLDAMRANLDPKRADAPLYRDDAAAWQATLRRLVLDAHGTDITDNTRLYVWECDNAECLADDDGPAHVNYPHEPGRLYDCPACEAQCHCDADPGTTECVYSGPHNFGKGE